MKTAFSGAAFSGTAGQWVKCDYSGLHLLRSVAYYLVASQTNVNFAIIMDKPLLSLFHNDDVKLATMSISEPI